MKIVVCVKRVPDTATKIKIAGDGKSIDRTDVEHIVSPYDELAAEHAIQIKEKLSDVEIVVVSLGPDGTEKIITHCLAMGADRGIFIQDNSGDHDSYVVAKALAEAIKEEQPDLVLFGVKAVDDDCSQVGGMVASLLGFPFIWSAAELTVADNKVTTQSEMAGEVQHVEAPLPCAISIQKGSVEARICSLINIRKARKKETKTITATLSEPTLAIEKLELPPTRVGGQIVGEGSDAVGELFRLLKEEAKVL